jgi:sodium/hydrogen antiporter
MHQLDLILVLLGFLTIALGLASKKLEQTPVPLSLLALLFGVAVGPAGLRLVDVAAIGERAEVLEIAARLTLAIGLIGVALRVPKEFVRQRWRQMAVLTGSSMLLGWIISTLLIMLILGVPLVVAALLGAILTPTDPIAANPIVTGPLAKDSLPGRVRHAISFDTGANDGLTFLFVFLPLLLLTLPAAEVARTFLLHTFLWQVFAATAIGAVLGFAAGWLLRVADAHDLIEEEWRLPYAAALSLLAVGIGQLLGSDELMLVFAAGIAFVQVVSSEERTGEEIGQEAINRFFAFPMFALLGATIPWSGWAELGWSGGLLAVALLLLRRPLPLLLIRPLLGDLRPKHDALFIGWFGPIGIAAIYYAALAEGEYELPLIWPVVSLVICASVVAHGVSGAPLTKRYRRIAGPPPAEDRHEDEPEPAQQYAERQGPDA